MKRVRPINQKSDMDLIKLFEHFGTEKQCREALEKMRWPDGVKCLRCQSDKVYRIHTRDLFRCESCEYQFSVKTATIFHDSHLPLPKWFAAIYLMSESKKGMSALQLKRTLKVAYKTAWYLCHRIREAVKDADTSLLSGICELDETYVGGKAKNMHKAVRERKIQGRGASGKAMVLGAIQRGGKVRLDAAQTPDRETLKAFIAAKLADETSAIMTDDFPTYEGCGDSNTRHETVNHSAKEYVRGDVHTNTMENVWSLFKRSIIGSYHQISVKHLDRYLDELEFRFNNRNNPYLFRDTLLRLLASSNLEYKELIKEKAA
jgi:transposase-like protein